MNKWEKILIVGLIGSLIFTLIAGYQGWFLSKPQKTLHQDRGRSVRYGSAYHRRYYYGSGLNSGK